MEAPYANNVKKTTNTNVVESTAKNVEFLLSADHKYSNEKEAPDDYARRKPLTLV